MSGCRSASQASRCGSRCLTELMFQVATCIRAGVRMGGIEGTVVGTACLQAVYGENRCFYGQNRCIEPEHMLFVQIIEQEQSVPQNRETFREEQGPADTGPTLKYEKTKFDFDLRRRPGRGRSRWSEDGLYPGKLDS